MTDETRERPLDSWKEIAAYLKRDMTTVRRWEKSQGLPVHRHLHHSRSSVFAYPSELDAWWASRRPAAEAEADARAAGWLRLRPIRQSAFGMALVLAAMTTADGVIVPPVTSAQSRGITARQLWTGPAVDISGAPLPDGTSLSFTDWDTGNLALRDLATGAARPLTNKGTWSDSSEFAMFSVPSPDGRQVAYAWFDGNLGWELRVVALDGTPARVIYAHPEVGYLQPAGWTPDGRGVVAILTRRDNTTQIAIVSAEDQSARVVKTLDWRYPAKASVSPDGRFLAYDLPPGERAPQRDIFLMAADGSGETPLVRHPANDFLPTWSPDGSQVVFVSDRAGTLGLWTIRVDAGRPRGAPEPLKTDIGRVSALAFTRDGSLYYGLETDMTDVYVAAVDVAAGLVLDPPAPATHRYVGSNSSGDWSPDGRRLVYVSQRSPRPGFGAAIVVQDIATGEERELALGLHLNRLGRPRWSPDGRQLVVLARGAGQLGLYGLDPDTGADRLLVPLDPAAYRGAPVWSADGKALFYTHPDREGLALRRHDLETGEGKVLYRSNAHNLAPSPDGRWLTFTMATGAADKVENVLMLLPLDGGDPRELMRVTQPDMFRLDGVVWTGDGRHLLVVHGDAGGPGSLWRLPIDGGTPQPLGVTMEGLNVGLRLHPDGRRIAFTSGERKSELWVLENLLPAR